MPLKLDYYYGNEAEQYRFYRVPKALFTDTRFKGVSVEAKVKSRFRKLDSGHIRYVMDCLDKNTTPIGNIRAYVLSALFNAPVTISQYYASLVRYDMAERAGSG